LCRRDNIEDENDDVDMNVFMTSDSTNSEEFASDCDSEDFEATRK